MPYDLYVLSKFKDKKSKWSKQIEFTPPHFSECCVWAKCPYSVYKKHYYARDNNLRTALKLYKYGTCTVIGNMAVPSKKVTS